MRRDPLLPGGQALRWADLVPGTFCLLPALSPHPQLCTAPSDRTPQDRAMSPGERGGGGGDARKGAPADGGDGGSPATAAWAWAVSALCLLLSVGSAAACLLLGAQATTLQGRVAALEEERELLRRTGSPAALAAWAEPHLERLLHEVRRRVGGSPAGRVRVGLGQCLRAGCPG